MSADAEKSPPSEVRGTVSLAGRLALATLGFCLIFSVIAISLQAWSAWSVHVTEMNAELALIEQVFRRTLPKAIWDLDNEVTESYLESAVGTASIGQIVIKVTPANRASRTIKRAKPGWTAPGLAPQRHLILTYEAYPGGPKNTVGELSLFGDERVLLSRVRSEVVGIAITQVVQFLLLTVFVLLLFNRAVTVHVQRIARHLASLTPETLDRPLALNRKSTRQDELTLLVAGVNHLQKNLQEYLLQQDRSESELAKHRDHLAELVAESTAELVEKNKQLAILSTTDHLTGLANRLRLEQVLEDELVRSRRSGGSFSVVLLDIDHFKSVNDTHGHQVGDQVLVAVAGLLSEGMRELDLPGRWGGEEFLVICRETDRAGAAVLAEKLREAIAAYAFTVVGTKTGSFGVASFRAKESIDGLISRADTALYRAKRGGRNRVEVEP